MSTPIIETIAEFIKDAINEITTGNGYNQTLTAIRPRRIHITESINQDLQVLVTQDSPAAATPVEGTSAATWWQPFNIEAIAIDSDDAATAIETRLNQIASDIIKKILIDETCDSNAHHIEIRSVEISHGPEISVVKVVIAVLYRTAYGDPYTSV